jgi:hypothetical protein
MRSIESIEGELPPRDGGQLSARSGQGNVSVGNPGVPEVLNRPGELVTGRLLSVRGVFAPMAVGLDLDLGRQGQRTQRASHHRPTSASIARPPSITLFFQSYFRFMEDVSQ